MTLLVDFVGLLPFGLPPRFESGALPVVDGLPRGLFVDGTFKDRELWKGCCVEHDVAYWQGGTKKEREQADLKFRDCIEKRTGDEALALLMYEAVRAGGGPYFPTWYRWGYGWPQGRGYKALTEAEQTLVELKLREYRSPEDNSSR